MLEVRVSSGQKIDQAEYIMHSDKDSALAILDEIDLTDLKVDSIRAKYNYLKGWL